MAKLYIFTYSVAFLYATRNVLADQKQDLDKFEGVQDFPTPLESSTALGNDALLFITNPDEDMPERWDSLSAIKLILERMPQTLQTLVTPEFLARAADHQADISHKNPDNFKDDDFQLNPVLPISLPISALVPAGDHYDNEDTTQVVITSEVSPVTSNMKMKEKKTFRFRNLGPEIPK